MTKNKVDPTKCPYFNNKTCLGQNPKSLARPVSTIFVDIEDKKLVSPNTFDFREKHGCSFCEKGKH